jgi:hypothetical protein
VYMQMAFIVTFSVLKDMIMRNHPAKISSLGLVLLLFNFFVVSAQTGYGDLERYIQNYDFNKRILPAIPVKGEKIRVIIDTDAKNEIDDQWAVTLALLSGDRFEIEGFIAANFDNSEGGPDGIEKSYQEIKLLLNKSGFEDKYPVYKGSHPMRYKYEPSESEGVDFIIQKAMESSPSEPVWVVALGHQPGISLSEKT